MTIYDRPDQLSLGKDIPAMGPFKGFKPNIVGPGSGKVKAAIKIAEYIARGLYYRPSLAGSISGIVIGTGVALNASQDAGTNQLNKALRSAKSFNNRKRNRNRSKRVKHCCTTCHC